MEDGLAENEKQKLLRQKSHMPEKSLLYEKVVPALLIGMGIVMVVLILFAAGVLLGFISF